jgi:hypothetical protein
MKINVVINEPEDMGNGVYRTTVSHPLLEGEMFFTHSSRNRDLTLGAMENSLVDDVKEIMQQVQELKK